MRCYTTAMVLQMSAQFEEDFAELKQAYADELAEQDEQAESSDIGTLLVLSLDC
jgi:hypothetical protein